MGRTYLFSIWLLKTVSRAWFSILTGQLHIFMRSWPAPWWLFFISYFLLWTLTFALFLGRTHFQLFLFTWFFQNGIKPVMLSTRCQRNLRWRNRSSICWWPLCSNELRCFYFLLIYLILLIFTTYWEWVWRLDLVELGTFSSFLNLLDWCITLFFLWKPRLFLSVFFIYFRFGLRISGSTFLFFWSWPWLFFL